NTICLPTRIGPIGSMNPTYPKTATWRFDRTVPVLASRSTKRPSRATTSSTGNARVRCDPTGRRDTS
ncbi:uncharacterized protein METZ01_LOCUS423782, partial [marine metagenome]